ncbi:MAG: type I DNA topoisomerase [Candidatus Terrybacteria bacterium]|nr:type I DNA topoisomerase [Candidatus Terrybacteria bacterium]
MKLIIVESPTKAKTISRFLSGDFKVESSYGHIRDLPKSKLGIDVEKNFEPTYVIPTKSRKRVNELKKEAEKSQEVILATDEDREGEAIAWHLTKALSLESAKRIVFHEITESAIKEALKNPRDIDLNLVDSQQARRILDRLVGYELSPFLWKKVFKGLSAGRVQSVAVRLIVDREREIEAFKPEEYWSIIATLLKVKSQILNLFEAKLIKKNDKILDKLEIKNKEEADKILNDLNGAEYKVEKIEKKETRRQPKPAFTTSTLQQEAVNKLHWSAKQIMILAQQLYESGFITYMRTDSVNLSEESLKSAKQVIEKNFGKEFSLTEPRRFKTKSKFSQEAHEAIRPSNPENTPQDLKDKLDAKQHKLYDLIWRRFIACQMKEAIFDSTTIDIIAKNYTFRATGSIMKFDGWMKAVGNSVSDILLPELSENEILELIKLLPNQHFTEPLPRYSEAALIKALEEYGIGRPSTYAPTISTIQTRNYVEKNEQKKFIPTETGVIVNNLLVEHFPEVVDMGFTAKIEDDLDEIAEGKIKWAPVIREFYEPFHKHLEEKYESVEKQTTDEETEEICEKCGKPMVIKHGRFGKFLACSGFPECKNARAIKKAPETIGMRCPKCNEGDVVIKRTKHKRIFYGCSRWPECDFASWQNPKKETAT